MNSNEKQKKTKKETGRVRGPALVLLLFYMNVSPADLFVLPASDDTGSLGFSPRRVVYPTRSTLGDCLQFPCGE